MSRLALRGSSSGTRSALCGSKPCAHAPVAAVVAAAVMVLAGCADAPIPTAPEPPAELLAKGGNGKGGGGDDGGRTQLLAEVELGDFSVVDAAGLLESTCPTAGTGQWHANFGHSECLIVSPDGAAYTLNDDVVLVVTREKGKNGAITHVTLLAQDVIGELGIHHSTDSIPVATPVVPDKAGFTIHVHATGIPVWRHAGHTGGERVEVIGRISIGDIVYFVQ